MAAETTFTNRAKYMIVHGTLDLDTAPLRLGLVKAACPTPTTIKLYNMLSELLGAAAEATCGNYVRKQGGGVNFTIATAEDDANNCGTITCTDVVWSTLLIDNTIYGAFLYVHNGANDALNELVAVHAFDNGIPTNGSSLTLHFPTNVLGTLS